jgi:hypothetical protein
MRGILPLGLLMLVFAVPAEAQLPIDRGWDRVPYLNGAWFGNGDERVPCVIIQRAPDGRALFINDQGSQAWGVIQGDRVWIPDWTDGMGSRGLVGRIWGDRIIWPNGSFWSR